jgi:hypothetical protein
MSSGSNAPKRLVAVASITGDVNGEGEKPTAGHGGGHATVLISKKRPKRSTKKRAEFRPSVGVRGADEETSLWNPGRLAGLKTLRSKLSSLANGKRARLKLFLMAALLCPLAVLSVKAVLPSDSARAPHMPDPPIVSDGTALSGRNTGEADGDRLKKPEAPPSTPLRPIGDGDVEAPGLAEAAEALVNGQLGRALDIYRRLAADDPSNAAHRMAVEILERQGGDGTP